MNRFEYLVAAMARHDSKVVHYAELIAIGCIQSSMLGESLTDAQRVAEIREVLAALEMVHDQNRRQLEATIAALEAERPSAEPA
jgi:hypothetical protein